MPQKNEPQPYEVLPPPDTAVWRYVTLPKLLSFIRFQSLYLCRADLFEDPFEGSFSEGSLKDHLKEWGSNFSESLVMMTRRMSSWSFVSCWHVSDVESAALWKIYSGAEGGLAIRSTVGVLQNLFPEIDARENDLIIQQGIRRVQYIDYRTEHPPINDLMGPLCYKRRAFAYEQEVRLIRQEIPTGPARDRPGKRSIKLDRLSKHSGVQVPIDPAVLIKTLHIAPSSPHWFLDVICETMRRFDFGGIPCRQSTLDDLPDYGRY